MKRSRILLILFFAIATMTSAARGDWGDWFDQFWCEAHYLNMWPDPYRCPDRQSATAPFELMKDRGWQLENTLVDALFTAEHELTYAGKLKIRHIMTRTPVHRRSIFVMRAASPRMTEKRLQVVQRFAADSSIDGTQAAVLVTDFGPREGSGDYLNQVNRRHRESVPPPVLPRAGGESEEEN